MESAKSKSVYAYGAEYGLYMGLYLTAISLCFMLSLYSMELSVAVYPLLIAVPVLLWVMMRRLYAKNAIFRLNSALWMFGICVFFFGSLICGGITVAFMHFVEPQFFSKYATMSMEFLQNSPLASQYTQEIELLGQAVEKQELPSPIDFVISMMWTTVFFGSLTSMILSPLVRLMGWRRAFKSQKDN